MGKTCKTLRLISKCCFDFFRSIVAQCSSLTSGSAFVVLGFLDFVVREVWSKPSLGWKLDVYPKKYEKVRLCQISIATSMIIQMNLNITGPSKSNGSTWNPGPGGQVESEKVPHVWRISSLLVPYLVHILVIFWLISHWSIYIINRYRHRHQFSLMV